MDSNIPATEQPRLYERLLSATPDLIWMFSADWDELLYMNDGYEELWGRPREAVREDTYDFVEGVHPDDRDRVIEKMAQLSEGDPAEIECRVNESEDYQRWVWVEGRPLVDDGEVTAVAGFSRDITERKLHERRLTALNDAVEGLIGASSVEEVAETAVAIAEDVIDRPLTAVWWADDERDGLVPLAATDAAGELSESSTAEHDAVGPIPPDTAEMAAFRSGEPRMLTDYETATDPARPETPLGSVYLVPLGEYGLLAVGTATVESFDTPTRTLIQILARSVEANFERVEREQELARKNRKLEEFTGVVSHDLRNPLNVALGRVNLHREDADGEELDRAAAALERMESLIEDTLVLARAGDAIDEREPVSIERLVHESWVRTATDRAEVRVADDIRVSADKSRLRLVFENLLRNAVEHTDDDVAITVGELSDGDGFYVSDTGSGIPAEEHEDVFESGYSTSDDGTGLGLSIVREIVTAHGWTVSVHDGPEGGVRFEVAGVETL
ncbi:receiver/sensor box histidine kinase [Halorarius halobius]|uniref:receiver/sensor box histidine kinase n=1 Tax=Halorarius halobius TaxID=2962671 RepID=UPI0020CBA840|nr:ATP-binding protein [Halorarius halobius]